MYFVHQTLYNHQARSNLIQTIMYSLQFIKYIFSLIEWLAIKVIGKTVLYSTTEYSPFLELSEWLENFSCHVIRKNVFFVHTYITCAQESYYSVKFREVFYTRQKQITAWQNNICHIYYYYLLLLLLLFIIIIYCHNYLPLVFYTKMAVSQSNQIW
jgi:hypothetical protein